MSAYLLRVLKSDSAAPRSARRFVRDTLENIGNGDPQVVDDAELLVSELLTNAVMYTAGSQTVVAISTQHDIVRVEVSDAGPNFTPPTFEVGLSEIDLTVHGGLGLGIVDDLSSSWGVDNKLDGKTIWFELSLNQRIAIRPTLLWTGASAHPRSHRHF